MESLSTEMSDLCQFAETIRRYQPQGNVRVNEKVKQHWQQQKKDFLGEDSRLDSEGNAEIWIENQRVA